MKGLTTMNINCVDLKRQQLLDVLVNNGVDLEDPNAFIIDEFEGVTGDWSDVTVNLSYLEDGDTVEFGINQQGFAAKWLVVKKVNDTCVYSLYNADHKTVYSTDADKVSIVNTVNYDCTVTIDEGEHYHVYELGSFTLDESERLLQALSELPTIVHDDITKQNFLELEWAWNNHNLNCADLLAVAENLGLIVDYTFKLK